MLNVRHQRGFTLIELLVTMVVLGILAAIATPAFTAFIRNTEVRGSSETMAHGLEYARTEAIRRNQQVCFDWSGTGTGWVVSTGCALPIGSVPAANVIQTTSNHDGSIATTIAITPSGGQRVTFNGYGRVVPNPVGGAPITRIDITAPSAGMQRRVLVSSGDMSGRIFVCDPLAASGTQLACS